MNAALIIAGGSGKRMGHDIPKQFIKIEGKPIIIYTLEAFEQHPGIEVLACIAPLAGEVQVRPRRAPTAVSTHRYPLPCPDALTIQHVYSGKVQERAAEQPVVHGDIIPSRRRI